MKIVKPKVYLIAEPTICVLDEDSMTGSIEEYLADIDAPSWSEVSPGAFDDGGPSYAEQLAEIAGRACYRSWAPGLNPNVQKVRSGNAAYLANVIASKHGSVSRAL